MASGGRKENTETGRHAGICLTHFQGLSVSWTADSVFVGFPDPSPSHPEPPAEAQTFNAPSLSPPGRCLSSNILHTLCLANSLLSSRTQLWCDLFQEAFFDFSRTRLCAPSAQCLSHVLRQLSSEAAVRDSAGGNAQLLDAWERRETVHGSSLFGEFLKQEGASSLFWDLFPESHI